MLAPGLSLSRAFVAFIAVSGASVLLTGCCDCDGCGPCDDADAGDADVESDADDDSERDADADEDADEDVDPTTPSSRVGPPEVSGSAGGGNGFLLLTGTVLAFDEGSDESVVHENGEVLVDTRTGVIDCVGELGTCNNGEPYEGAAEIRTEGVISPGLINAHDHGDYGILGEWVPDPPRCFGFRDDWQDLDDYETHIAPIPDCGGRNECFCPMFKYEELRNLINGTTMIQGQPRGRGNCIHWGIRNATMYHMVDDLSDIMGCSIEYVCSMGRSRVSDVLDQLTTGRFERYHWHVGEGAPGNAACDREFGCLDRAELPDGSYVSLLDGASINGDGSYGEPQYAGAIILIHGICLTREELERVRDTGTMIVFSPSSEEALYCDGVYSPVASALELGIPVALGPDWTVSGEDNMLAEMRYAQRLAEEDEGLDVLTSETIWRMATVYGAYVLGFDEYIGMIAPGKQADIVVFGRRHPTDPHRAVIESTESDVDLVLIGGRGYYGTSEVSNLVDVVAHPSYRDSCEVIPVCESERFVCAADPTAPGNFNEQTFDEIEGAVCDYLDTYGRCGENPLVPLESCMDE